jgi:cell division protein FtsN
MTRRDPDTDDDAPWLAPAGTPARARVSRRSLFWTAFVLLGLAAVASVGLIMLLSKKDSGSTQGYMNAEQAPLITALPGPYKQPPLDPRGMAVEGQDQTIYAAGKGIDEGSTIDMSAKPEQPLPRPAAGQPPPGPPRNLVPEAMSGAPATPPATAPQPAAVPSAAPPRSIPVQPAIIVPPRATEKPAAPPPAKPKPTPDPVAKLPVTPAKGPGTAQLGAFSTEEKANAAWASLAASHGGLAGFSKRLIKIEANGKTLWRLRAGGGDAAALCAKMKAGGDACTVVE